MAFAHPVSDSNEPTTISSNFREAIPEIDNTMIAKVTHPAAGTIWYGGVFFCEQKTLSQFSNVSADAFFTCWSARIVRPRGGWALDCNEPLAEPTTDTNRRSAAGFGIKVVRITSASRL